MQAEDSLCHPLTHPAGTLSPNGRGDDEEGDSIETEMKNGHDARSIVPVEFLPQPFRSDEFFDRVQVVEDVLRSAGGIDELRRVQVDAHVVVKGGVDFLVIDRTFFGDLALAA